MTEPLRRVDHNIWRQNHRTCCPACGHAPDAFAVTAGQPRAPEDGDWSVCINCGEVTVIEIHPLLGARLREATTPELAEFSADPANAETVRRIHRFNAASPGPTS